MGKLDGKVAVVTGAGSGIGEATARAMTHEGAAVVIADINMHAAQNVARALVGEGQQALAVDVDVSDENQVARMVESVLGSFGGIDVLHNNAAILAPEHACQDTDILHAEVAVWNKAFAVNLIGALLTCKHVIPSMTSRGGGSIINMSSGAGIVADVTRPAYAASKCAINALTRSVATIHGKTGIRCNSVAPGLVMTPAIRAHLAPNVEEQFERHHLTPTVATPDMIADVVTFLASDEARFITGQVIVVDGGLLSHLPTYAEDSARDNG